MPPHRQREGALGQDPPSTPEGPPRATQMPPPPLPPPLPFLPPHTMHYPVPMGHSQHPVPSVAMNIPWYPQPRPYGMPTWPPLYPPLQPPHLVHGAGIGATQLPPWGYMHHPMVPPLAPVPDLVATQAGDNGTPPVKVAQCHGDADKSTEVCHKAGETTVASTTGVPPRKKKYLNLQISDRVWQFLVNIIDE
ncbi:hypothetical protein BJV78DRAFT_1283044 [Lactifluus subvellereus]|nr:hypothetical protein BJV78DRAFT_1283044 [Lactifluus subvellereus]